MTWSVMWAILRSKAGQIGVLVMAALAGLGLARRHWMNQGADNLEQEIRDDTQRRVQSGRDALRDGRGDDPDERLRNNDGKW